jgi:hypothetical protein
MFLFNNAHESHAHSLIVLNLLKEHDTFMESISSVADMGAGAGMDCVWWNNATTRDTPSEPLNLKVFAVDRVAPTFDFELPERVVPVTRDFEKPCLSTTVDVIWCHDAFQFALNPVQTLKVWNTQLNENGLLYIGMPLLNYNKYNRWQSYGRNFQYYNHSFLGLVYMLAVNGFDCRDAYFRKQTDDPWLHAAVFKTAQEPQDPATTTWYDLVEAGLLNESLVNSLRTFGYVREQDALFPWLDKALYRIEP